MPSPSTVAAAEEADPVLVGAVAAFRYEDMSRADLETALGQAELRLERVNGDRVAARRNLTELRRDYAAFREAVCLTVGPGCQSLIGDRKRRVLEGDLRDVDGTGTV